MGKGSGNRRKVVSVSFLKSPVFGIKGNEQ
jgi:hypothetical protein